MTENVCTDFGMVTARFGVLSPYKCGAFILSGSYRNLFG